MPCTFLDHGKFLDDWFKLKISPWVRDSVITVLNQESEYCVANILIIIVQKQARQSGCGSVLVRIVNFVGINREEDVLGHRV